MHKNVDGVKNGKRADPFGTAQSLNLITRFHRLPGICKVGHGRAVAVARGGLALITVDPLCCISAEQTNHAARVVSLNHHINRMGLSSNTCNN